MLKYRCLILDHDDTVVQSSTAIHYPAFLQVMAKLRPSYSYSYDEYRSICFQPGIREFYRTTLNFTSEELDYSESSWFARVERTIPEAFDGIKEVLVAFKQCGGIIAVNSHSHTSFIERDYQNLFGFKPDVIIGYDSPSSLVKPNIGMIDYLYNQYSIVPNEMLMVDDLKPGQIMAQRTCIDFAAAGYGITVDKMKQHFKETSTYYLEHASELQALLFLGGKENVTI